MILKVLLDWLYPSKCVFCHKITEDGVLFCGECVSKLPYSGQIENKQTLEKGLLCYSPLYYERYVRDSILRYKFNGATAYCKVYAYLLGKCIDENKIFCDIISWVPLSKLRLRRRGYDQAELIARELASILNVPCVPTLKKIKHTRAQSATGSKEKRKANIAGAYSIYEGSDIKGKSILIIDDVVTTGSTLSECADVLAKAGVGTINAMTVARKRN